MNDKIFNIIFKIFSIALAVVSFVGAIMVWFLNYQVSKFGIGWNYFFIGAMSTLMAMTKITDTKN